MALTVEEAEVGKRVRLVRKSLTISQRLAAAYMGLSRQQLDRIERGEVSVRFLPALRFCEFTDTSPSWLAFRDPDLPFRFFWLEYDSVHEKGYRVLRNITGVAASQIASDAIFLDVMQRHKSDYQREAIPVYESTANEIPRSVGLQMFWSNVSHQLTNERKLGKVGSMKLHKVAFWPALRERIHKLVQERGMKSALARDIGVSRQAVNALLGKKYVPSGEQVLRLSKWVEIAEAQQTKSAGALTPAPKTRRKSKHEKPSDRKKK